jgi:ComF family protein
MRKYWLALKNLFFPVLCFCCETKIDSGYLCQPCLKKIEFLHPPLCRYCSQPITINSTGLCKKCLFLNPPYTQIISALVYQEPLAQLIHLFKYKNIDYLSELFSALMLEHLQRIGFTGQGYDFISYVPLHSLRQKERGYNQSRLLAKSLVNYFKTPLKDDIIYQNRYTPSQTKLEKLRRRENIKNSFITDYDLFGKKIILVDDIFTTGATITAAARTLKEKKAETITVLTLAKTMDKP